MSLHIIQFERAYDIVFKEFYDSTEARLIGNRYLYAKEQMEKIITVQQNKAWRRYP